MIRTRDLVIFCAVFLGLCLAIASTIVLDWRARESGLSFPAYFEMATTSQYAAEAPANDIDRESIISRLRTALSSMEREVEPSVSVEESPSLVSDDDPANVPLLEGVLSCGGDDSLGVVASWPLSGVSMSVVGGVRTVAVAAPQTPSTSVVATSSASSSVAVAQPATKTLIALSAYPNASGAQACVPGDVVGVTVTGALILNTEASFYRGYGSEYLIGYARDGFPIYGYFQGQVDQCGGYAHPNGYRYTITPDRPYVIGCYVGTPASFSM